MFCILFLCYIALYRMSTGHPAAQPTTKLFPFHWQASQPGFFQIWTVFVLLFLMSVACYFIHRKWLKSRSQQCNIVEIELANEIRYTSE